MIHTVHGLGLYVRRVARYLQNRERPSRFRYVFPKSCQIPNLGFIYERIFGSRVGRLIEIGAHDGISFSNSSGLLDAGWSGALYEPVPIFYNELTRRYRDNPRVELFNLAVGSASGNLTLSEAGVLTSASTEQISEYRRLPWSRRHVTDNQVSAKQVTLRDVFDNFGNDVDLLIVDVEGWEHHVFADFETQSCRPGVLIVELTDFHPDLRSQAREHFNVGSLLLRCGYQVVYKDSINTVFVLAHLLKNIFED